MEHEAGAWPADLQDGAWCEAVLTHCWAVLHERHGQASALPAEVSIVLSDDAHIQTLNAQYRHKDKPTNVLSFPQFEEWAAFDSVIRQGAEQVPLGDIVLAFETLAREAKENQRSLKEHLTHLLIHGFLHLCGYDHEACDEAEAMEALEIALLAHFDIQNPYIITESES